MNTDEQLLEKFKNLKPGDYIYTMWQDEVYRYGSEFHMSKNYDYCNFYSCFYNYHTHRFQQVSRPMSLKLIYRYLKNEERLVTEEEALNAISRMAMLRELAK